MTRIVSERMVEPRSFRIAILLRPFGMERVKVTTSVQPCAVASSATIRVVGMRCDAALSKRPELECSWTELSVDLPHCLIQVADKRAEPSETVSGHVLKKLGNFSDRV